MDKLLKTVVLVLVIAGFGLTIWWFLNKGGADEQTMPQPTTQNKNNGDFSFENPKKSAHYESNTPAHASVLAGVPVNVVIDFNFDLAEPSSISITMDNKEYGTGETIIDENKLSMRRSVNAEAPDGLYTVSYNACWPDGSCHDGLFQFAVDRNQAASFMDLRGQKEVTIHMSNTTFNPANIRISNGTKVTWINDDGVDHFVNTDSHPAHTYLPGMNSRSLAPNASYSFTFDQNGFYPYHCSAHASTMSGAVLVE